tara:strand:+ start:126766 stop:127209 length:444 start_codon:yes stop_codon:yes gene_type:complete
MLKKLGKKIISKNAKNWFYDFYSELIRENHREKSLMREQEIQAVELEEKHLKNLIFLPNRLSLLEKLSKGGTVEIGVDTGSFSKLILEYNKPKKKHLIDTWDSQRYNQYKKNIVGEKFKKEIASGLVEINLGYSTKVASHFKDDYFD